jgi:hypothetical protein
MLLVVVQLLIKTSSGFALLRSVFHDLKYLFDPVIDTLKFCVALVKCELILNTFHAGNLIILLTGVSIV